MTDANASRRATASAEIDADAEAAAEAVAVAFAVAAALTDAHTCGAKVATTFSGSSWLFAIEANIASGNFRKLDAIADSCFTHTQLIGFAMPFLQK